MAGVEHWSEWTGGFSPFQFGALLAGYEADYGITLNVGKVAAWVPRWVAPGETPAGLALTQATAALQPLYNLNRGDGKPVLICDGVDDYLLNATIGTRLALGEYTAVLACTQLTADGRYISVCENPASERAIDCYRAGPVITEGPYSGGFPLGTKSLVPAAGAQYRALTVHRAGTLGRLLFGAVEAVPATYASPLGTVSPVLTLGAFTGGVAPGPLRVSALWLYSHAVLSVADVHAAMTRRWGT